MPTLRPGGEKKQKEPISDWARRSFMKPDTPDAQNRRGLDDGPATAEELTDLSKTTDDKERLVGLIAAPLAALIGYIVVHVLVVDDPPRLLKNGALDTRYVDPNTYYDVFLVVIALALGVLAFSLLRKRLPTGICLALYGLAIFNLHYWGFGIPFLLAGAWYIVRAYRLQKDLKMLTADTGRTNRQSTRPAAAPRQNMRYTPRSPGSKRASRPRRAG